MIVMKNCIKAWGQPIIIWGLVVLAIEILFIFVIGIIFTGLYRVVCGKWFAFARLSVVEENSVRMEGSCTVHPSLFVLRLKYGTISSNESRC